MSARQGLRRELRERRRELPAAVRIEASQAIARHLLALVTRLRYRRIAAFVAADGEADPGPFIAVARELGRRIHLPVLDPSRTGGMRFVHTEAGQPLVANRHGIPEPATGAEIRPRQLDLVLMPLVGFDARGNRLGMGAGFYDRCFAFRRARAHWHKPVLLGVAYECQRVESIEPAAWDVPLDGTVTETGVHYA